MIQRKNTNDQIRLGIACTWLLPAVSSGRRPSTTELVVNCGGLGLDIFRVRAGKITEHWDAVPEQKVELLGQPGS
jgi:hypothetical protein